MSRRPSRARIAEGEGLPPAGPHVIANKGDAWPVSSDPAHPHGNPPIGLPEELPPSEDPEQRVDDGSET